MNGNFYEKMESLVQLVADRLKLPEAILPVEPERFLTAQETADHLHVSVRTIRRYRQLGRLTAFYVGGIVYYALSELKPNQK